MKPLYDPAYDRLWAVIEELEVPVNVHGGTGVPDYGPYPVSMLLYINEVPASTPSGRWCSSSCRASSSASPG